MSDPAKVFLGNPDYDGQLVRTLTATLADAADLGEALATARRVDKLDGASWYDAWSRTATVARAAGDAAKNAGSRVTARHAFLRASEYFRQAYYFIRSDLDDPRLQSAYRGHVETFSAASELMDHPAEHVRIPYEGTTISGYLFAPDASGAARPTLLFPCGYDVLVFEGPGQGEALFTQRLFFRTDYEKVLTPVIDWLQGRPEVDASRIALVGRSFAGYLALRGAAFEHRLAALVCDPAQPDMGAHLPEGLVGKVAVPVVEMQVRFSGARAEFFGARMAAHGLDSIEAYLTVLRTFNMLPDAPHISCPTLLIECENDFAGGGAQVLHDAMSVPADIIHLTVDQGIDGHCGGPGAEVWAEAAFDWLDRTVGDRRPATVA
jgi:hypothetical protein